MAGGASSTWPSCYVHFQWSFKATNIGLHVMPTLPWRQSAEHRMRSSAIVTGLQAINKVWFQKGCILSSYDIRKSQAASLLHQVCSIAVSCFDAQDTNTASVSTGSHQCDVVSGAGWSSSCSCHRHGLLLLQCLPVNCQHLTTWNSSTVN